MAPEYAASGKLTDKSDVFSYGVMLLELITGRRPVDSSYMEDSLVDWVSLFLVSNVDALGLKFGLSLIHMILMSNAGKAFAFTSTG